MKHTCAECGLKAKTLVPYMKLVDTTVLYVCRQCYQKHGYDVFFSPDSETGKYT